MEDEQQENMLETKLDEICSVLDEIKEAIVNLTTVIAGKA